ncbi:MAG: hypothetical protein ABW249_07475, partial [Solirubrobacterales bacterium]
MNEPSDLARTAAAPDDAAFDAATCAQQLGRRLAETVAAFGRRGAVVAVSGGVDSGVVAGLCA